MLPLFLLHEFIDGLVHLLDGDGVVFRHGLDDAVLQMFLQQELAGVGQLGTNGCDLDQYVGAVDIVLDHPLHGFQVTDAPGETVDDFADVLGIVGVGVRMCVSVRMRVLMTVCHAVFVRVFMLMYRSAVRAVFMFMQVPMYLMVIVAMEMRRAVAVCMIMAGAGLFFVCMIVHEWNTSCKNCPTYFNYKKSICNYTLDKPDMQTRRTSAPLHPITKAPYGRNRTEPFTIWTLY